MQVELKQLHRKTGTTFLYVTHDQEEALTMSDRVAVMRHGRIAQIGSPEQLYEEPADEFVASFIGEMNFVSPEFCFASAPADGPPMVAAVRPERVLIAARPESSGDRRWMAGVVEESVYCGEARRFKVRVGDTIVVSKRQAGTDPVAFAPGDAVQVGWLPDDLKLLKRA
jgi:ABC-type Fe3+/spermidine/putrescine transport system ATPase subunit